mgnify:CR=1 FL=1
MDLTGFLLVGAALIALGAWGTLRQRGALAFLIALQVAFAGLLLTATAFWHFVAPYGVEGLLHALSVLTGAVALATVGISMLLAHRRHRRQGYDEGEQP